MAGLVSNSWEGASILTCAILRASLDHTRMIMTNSGACSIRAVSFIIQTDLVDTDASQVKPELKKATIRYRSPIDHQWSKYQAQSFGQMKGAVNKDLWTFISFFFEFHQQIKQSFMSSKGDTYPRTKGNRRIPRKFMIRRATVSRGYVLAQLLGGP